MCILYINQVMAYFIANHVRHDMKGLQYLIVGVRYLIYSCFWLKEKFSISSRSCDRE